ncbi:MAG: DUF924 family protein [Rhodobacteraceae bacterium]|jgi:uncharacterized protein (DUF924 family)|nr:DUF924 family protein [Paracoccaceae bacterium]
MLQSTFLHPRILETFVRPADVVAFWRDAGPGSWFAKDPVFDMRFRALFADVFAYAEREALAAWEDTPEGALALVLLLDQYPRNAFRGTARMYATDGLARAAARRAIRREFDLAVARDLRVFLYLPFGHSESLLDQAWAVTLCTALDEAQAARARHHHDIVERFGRFPHRNALLGRSSTPDEAAWLAAGGYAG